MKRKKLLRGLICILLVCILCEGIPDSVYAAGTYYNYASYPVDCHFKASEDGNLIAVYPIKENGAYQIIVDVFSPSGIKLDSKRAELPGTTWGGSVYWAEDGCKYVATGDGKDTAFYISKFSADWKLLGTASVGKEESYTQQAFHAGNCDMTMVGKYLIVHAARLRLDGHQSNTTFYIDVRNMKPVYITGEFGFDHVSHSFNQFVRSLGDQVIMVDHGDAHPRAIVLQSYQLVQPEYAPKKTLSLMKIWGSIGQNRTDVTVGGFELGSQNHIVTGKSVPHDKFTSKEEYFKYEGSDNIYLILVDKTLKNSKLKWLTSYNENEKISISDVSLIKINDDRFVILYNILDDRYQYNDTCYKLVNSAGEILKSGTRKGKDYYWYPSEPAILGDSLVWCGIDYNERMDESFQVYPARFLTAYQWNMKTGNFDAFHLNLNLSERTPTLALGQAYRIQATGNDGQTVTWKSDNPKVAQVDQKGVITGLKRGITKITAASNGKQDACTVTVSGKRWVPPKTTIVDLTRKNSTSMVVKWRKKQSITGYQICYAKSSSFRKGKIITVKNASATKETVKKMKKIGGPYFVKVRTYKKVKIKGKNTILYSEWSKAKDIWF